MQPYLVPIAELLAEWPDIDPGPARLRRAWQLLAARAELATTMQTGGR